MSTITLFMLLCLSFLYSVTVLTAHVLQRRRRLRRQLRQDRETGYPSPPEPAGSTQQQGGSP